MDEICYIQLSAADAGVSFGFQNHTEQSLYEVRACLFNGTRNGGMQWATVPDDQFDPANPHHSTTLSIPSMSEHGPLWRTSQDGYPRLRVNHTVDYPWHGALSPSFDQFLAEISCSMGRRHR